MRRLDSNRMPPLGTRVVDVSYANHIEGWIRRTDVCANVGVPPATDTDGDGVYSGDGVPGNADNCKSKYNPDQADDDGDGFGNRCDGDFNGDLATDMADRDPLLAKANAMVKKNDPNYVAAMDINHDFMIDQNDLGIFDADLKDRRPGPSALGP
jgi:Thrombospondin type 3 repeat